MNALISLTPLQRGADFDEIELFREPRKPAPPAKVAPAPAVKVRRADPAPLAAPLPAPLSRARSARGTAPQPIENARITTERVKRSQPPRIWYLATITAVAVTSATIAYAMKRNQAAKIEHTEKMVPARIEAPVVALAPVAPAPRIQLVDVRFDSEPAGASVTIIDGPRSIVLGNTPLITAVDPARMYEVAFASPDRPVVIQLFDPSTKHLAVSLPAAELAPPARPTPTPAPRAAPPAHHAVAVAGTGTLMISSKPPCAISIDGRATGLVTPQRSISLPAGHHEITLVNAQTSITKSFGVDITTAHATRVIRDLMPH